MPSPADRGRGPGTVSFIIRFWMQFFRFFIFGTKSRVKPFLANFELLDKSAGVREGTIFYFVLYVLHVNMLGVYMGLISKN